MMDAIGVCDASLGEERKLITGYGYGIVSVFGDAQRSVSSESSLEGLTRGDRVQ